MVFFFWTQIFQIGPNEEQTSKLSLRDMKPTSLANGISNESSYQSLADLDLTSFKGAQDSIRLIDKAIDESQIILVKRLLLILTI